MERLDVDEDLANTLIQEGFTSLEEVAYVPVNELMEIESFESEMVDELRKRARDSLLVDAIVTDQEADAAEGKLSNVEGISEEIVELLLEKGINSQEELADLATDDLVDLIGLDEEPAKALIMAARAPWFKEN